MAASVRLLSADNVAPARAAFVGLEQRVGASNVAVAASWTWVAAWLRQYADVVGCRFAVGELDGRICGAALLCHAARRSGDLWLRRLHVGTAGEPKHHSVFAEDNALLAAPGDEAAFAAGLLSTLRADESWDELLFDAYGPADAATLKRFEPGLVLRPEVSPYTDLFRARDGGGEVLGLLRTGVRQRFRSSLRRYGDLRTQVARSADASDVLDDLIALHQARWTAAGHRGAFSSPRFAAFHRSVAPRLVAEGRAILFRVATASGTTIACLYGFVQHGRFLFYQSGLALTVDNRDRPGLVAHVLLMQACAERGLEAYDLLPGDSRYKRELATDERELVWATARRRRARPMLLDLARRVAARRAAT